VFVEHFISNPWVLILSTPIGRFFSQNIET